MSNHEDPSRIKSNGSVSSNGNTNPINRDDPRYTLSNLTTTEVASLFSRFSQTTFPRSTPQTYPPQPSDGFPLLHSRLHELEACLSTTVQLYAQANAEKADGDIKLFKARELLSLSTQMGPELSYKNYDQNGGQVNLVLERFAGPVDAARKALEKAEGYVVFLGELAKEIAEEIMKVRGKIGEVHVVC
jgi:hypothetical protein